jgi:CTP:molybdopterin cytidylyltransferase MocA
VTGGQVAPVVGGIVLAAGEARRMGGRPKALIERGGVPLVRCVTQALLEAGVRDVVVVLGHRAEAVAAALAGLPVACAVNHHYCDGRVSSLRAGLSTLPDGVESIVIALADQPLLGAEDVRALLRAFDDCRPARAVVPRVHGVRGHPVVLEAGVGREILRRDADFGVRHWLQEHPAQLSWFDNDNDHYCVDIDAPEDLARIERRHGCTLRWPADS